MSQIHARGWIRCLPVEAGCTLLIVATVSALGLKGQEMWDHIELLWQQSMNYVPSPEEREAIDDVENRFLRVYALDYEKTSKGVVNLLMELGLVIRYKIDGEEYLDVPDILPHAR
jgi:hypothetical protein